MLDAIVPFILLAIFGGGIFMDFLGIKFKSESPEAREAFRVKVREARDLRWQQGIEAEARAIVSREKREIELRAELDRLRAERQAQA